MSKFNAGWEQEMQALIRHLAEKLPETKDARRYAKSACMATSLISFPDQARDAWASVVQEASPRLQNCMVSLLDSLLSDYPDDQILIRFRQRASSPSLTLPPLDDARWRADPTETREKILGAKSTLLPVNFLEEGAMAARAVAKIQVDLTDSSYSGTGFLIRDELFVTNNHILPTSESAKLASIHFNHHSPSNSSFLSKQTEVINLQDEFFTSEEFDCTVVRLKKGTNTKWGMLTLSERLPRKWSAANIIQHPGGRTKEIGIHNNFVADVNENFIQYLTDTEPGSSGSPVLDNSWNVIALHHSGGTYSSSVNGKSYRTNEGTSALRLSKLLKEWSL